MSAEIDRPVPGAYKPRAQAVLVALRLGPLTTRQLSIRIADSAMDVTRALLCDMITDTIDHKRGGDPFLWYLTSDGVAWLETNGLSVSDEACL